MDRLDDGEEDEHDGGAGDNDDDVLRHVDDIDLDQVRPVLLRHLEVFCH